MSPERQQYIHSSSQDILSTGKTRTRRASRVLAGVIAPVLALGSASANPDERTYHLFTHAASHSAHTFTPESFGIDAYTREGERLMPQGGTVTEHTFFNDEKWRILHLLHMQLGQSGIEMHDVSPDEVQPEVLNLVRDTLSNVQPFVTLALERGYVNQIVVGTDLREDDSVNTTDRTGFIPRDNTMFIDVDIAKDSFSREYMSYAATHELGHAFFSDTPFSMNSMEVPDAQELAAFNSACVALRDIAVDQIEERFAEARLILNRLSQISPEHAVLYEEIVNAADERRLNKLYPSPQESEFLAEKVRGCEVPKVGGLLSDLIYEKHMQFGFAYSSFEQPLLRNANTVLGDILRYETVYRVFTDETYTGDRLAGHPYDLDEKAASEFMLTVHFPDAMVDMLRQLPAEHREIYLASYNQTMATFTEDPQLASLLQENIDTINAA